MLPIDSVQILADDRGRDLDQDQTARLDWDALRHNVREQGMRNSNVLAIAPTATTSNIVGVSQSIEPTYGNLFVKANMSGDFTVVNEHLVDAEGTRPALDIRHARGEVDAAGDRRQVDRSPTRGGRYGTAARARLFHREPRLRGVPVVGGALSTAPPDISPVAGFRRKVVMSDFWNTF